MPDLDARVTLLERMAAQQLDLNDQLSALTRRLEHEQFLHDAAQVRHATVLDRQAEILATLTQIQQDQHRHLAALAALAAQHQDRMERLERGDGH